MPNRQDAARTLLETEFIQELADELDRKYWTAWKGTTDDQELRDIRFKSVVLADLVREIRIAATEVIDYGRTDRASTG